MEWQPYVVPKHTVRQQGGSEPLRSRYLGSGTVSGAFLKLGCCPRSFMQGEIEMVINGKSYTLNR